MRWVPLTVFIPLLSPLFQTAYGAHTMATDALLTLSLEELMEIEVQSATKINQSLTDIPAKVSIITRDDIRNYGYTSFIELLRNTPGIYLEEDTADVFLGSRGTIGGSIQILVNGVPQHPSLQKGLSTREINRLNIPIAAIDRIEFIHGPMSVIYGNSAFLGVINVITHLHEGNLVRGTVGARQAKEAFVRTNNHLGTVHYSVNLGLREQNTFEGDYVDMVDASKQAYLNPPFLESMEDHLERRWKSIDGYVAWGGWTAQLKYQRLDQVTSPITVPLADNTMDISTWQGSVQYQQPLSDYWLSSSTLIASQEKNHFSDLRFLAPDLRGFQNQRSERYEFEQTLAYTDLDSSWLLGYRALQIQNVGSDLEFLVNGLVLIDGDSQLDTHRTQEAFVQWQAQLNEHWRLITGGRYSRLPSQYRAVIERDKLGTTDIEQSPVSDRNQYNYNLALLYQWSARHSIKLLHGTATQDNDALLLAQPESIRLSELVYTYESGHWYLQPSLYSSRTKDILRRGSSATSNSLDANNSNTGQWHGQGVELSVQYRPIEQWRLAGSVNLQSTKDQVTPETPGYSPRQLWKLQTDYRYQNHTYAVYAHFVGSRHSDWRFLDLDNDGQPDATERVGERVDSYWNLNANWRYSLSSAAHLNLNISNLLDEEYRYAANNHSDLEKGLIAVGRQVSLGLEIEL